MRAVPTSTAWVRVSRTAVSCELTLSLISNLANT
jgi:hypothetical protein